MFIAVNYVAVLVATIAGMAIGAMWYGPVFGKYWMRLTGLTPESMKAMPLTPWQAMAMGFIAMFITNWVLAQVIGLLGVMDVTAALELVALIWLGFYFTSTSGVFLWEGKSYRLWLFNAAQYLVALSVAAAIIASWQ